MFAALIVSIIIAVRVGLAIGLSPIGRGILDLILEFLRPITPLVYLPLIIIWFGIGELSKVLVIFLAMLAPVALSTASGMRKCIAGAVERLACLRCEPMAIGTLRCHPAHAFIYFHQHTHCVGYRLDNTRCSHTRARLHDPVSGTVSCHRCRDYGDYRHCSDRFCSGTAFTQGRSYPRTMGRPRLEHRSDWIRSVL